MSKIALFSIITFIIIAVSVVGAYFEIGGTSNPSFGEDEYDAWDVIFGSMPVDLIGFYWDTVTFQLEDVPALFSYFFVALNIINFVILGMIIRGV